MVIHWVHLTGSEPKIICMNGSCTLRICMPWAATTPKTYFTVPSSGTIRMAPVPGGSLGRQGFGSVKPETPGLLLRVTALGQALKLLANLPFFQTVPLFFTQPAGMFSVFHTNSHANMLNRYEIPYSLCLL